jgi:hypothetical protein
MDGKSTINVVQSDIPFLLFQQIYLVRMKNCIKMTQTMTVEVIVATPTLTP